MSLVRKVAHNTFLQASGKIIGTALGVAAAFFLFRYLGDYKYGQYTTIMVYLQIFGILMDLGLFIVLIKKISQAEEKFLQNKIVNNTFTFRLLTGLILLSIAVIVSWFIPQYSLIIKWGILITAVNFLFISLNQIMTAIFQKHMAMGKVALAEISGKVFLFLSTVSIVYIFQTGLLTVMLTVILGGFVNFLILFISAQKYYKIKLAFDFKIWRELFTESWPIAISISLNMLYFKADTLLLGWLKSQEEVGIYGAPYKILEVIITLPAMFVGLLLPVLSSSYKKQDMPSFRKIFQKSFDALAIMVLPMIAGTLVVAKPLMILMTGTNFTTNLDDLGRILQILIFAVGFIFVGTLTGYLIVVVNKQKAAIKAYAFVAVTALAGYLIFIPKFSYFGAAAVTVYSEAMMMLFGFYYIYSVTKTVPKFNIFSKALLASLIMAAFIYFLPAWNIVISICLGSIVYVGFLYLLKGISKQEALEIISLRKK